VMEEWGLAMEEVAETGVVVGWAEVRRRGW